MLLYYLLSHDPEEKNDLSAAEGIVFAIGLAFMLVAGVVGMILAACGKLF